MLGKMLEFGEKYGNMEINWIHETNYMEYDWIRQKKIDQDRMVKQERKEKKALHK